jgi:hypothetical protein
MVPIAPSAITTRFDNVERRSAGEAATRGPSGTS